MTCPSCSAPVRPLATVCTACWTDLEAAPEPAPACAAVATAEPEAATVTATVVPAASATGRGWSTPVEAWYSPSTANPRAPKGRHRR